MKLIVNKNRTTTAVGTWGTENENNYEILHFEFPEELEDYNKRIVYYLGDGKVWDAIVDDKAYITNAITKYEKVKAYVWCTKTDDDIEKDIDFRTKLFEMNFYENENADGIVPTEEQVDGFNTMLTAMNNKINEINEIEENIETAEATRVANETTRQENETTRQANEGTRQANEITRQQNEQARQVAEVNREERTDAAIADIQDKTAEYNANAEAKTTAFNNNALEKTNTFNDNATSKTGDFNSNASSKTNDFNSNATAKTNTFNSNASDKTSAFNTNATNKTTAFNDNYTSKLSAFNDNASSKTTDFNTNASNKATAFDNNASAKTTTFDENATAKTTAFNDNATAKTGDFNDNVTTKTTEFDAHVTEKEAEFDENVDSIQEQITDIQEFIDSELEQGITEKGTRADVNDSAKWYGELAPEGRTEQKQLSGKNLFDINGLDIRGGGVKKTIINDRIVELEAITTTGAQFVGEVIELDSTKNYTFSCKAKKIVCEPTGYSMIRAYLAGSNDGETYTVISRDDIPSPVVNTEYSLVRSFTGYTYLRIYLYNRAESTVVIGEKTQYYDIQVEEGDTATDYEEFVGGQASPNPNYPQDIRNVEGRSCRNLFDGEWTGSVSTNFISVYAGKNYKYSEHGVAKGMNFRFYNDTSSTEYTTVNVPSSDYYTPEADGYVKLYKTAADKYDCQLEEGTAVTPYEPYFKGKRLEFNVCNKNLFDENTVEFISGVLDDNGQPTTGQSHYTENFYPVKPETIYSLLGTLTSATLTSSHRIYFYDKDKKWLSRTTTQSPTTHQFTTPANCYFIRIQVANNVTLQTGDIVLCEGIETKYIAHQQQTILFPMATNQKLMEGDYLADDGIHHVRTKMTLNGTETWNQYTSIDTDNYYGYRVDAPANMKLPPNSTTLTNYVSDKFAEISWNSMMHVGNKPAFAIRYDNARVYIHAPFATIAELTEWLSNNNMTIEYDLTQEVIDPYTEAQAEAYNQLKKFMMYFGVDHIWCNTDGVYPNMQLAYYKSNRLRLDSIEARLELLES